MKSQHKVNPNPLGRTALHEWLKSTWSQTLIGINQNINVEPGEGLTPCTSGISTLKQLFAFSIVRCLQAFGFKCDRVT